MSDRATELETLLSDELIEYYDFYVDNCTDDETPLTYKEWVREYLEEDVCVK